MIVTVRDHVSSLNLTSDDDRDQGWVTNRPVTVGHEYRDADPYLKHTVYRLSYVLAMQTSKVGRIFVGETKQRILAPKNDYRRICALRHKVGEIEPLTVTITMK